MLRPYLASLVLALSSACLTVSGPAVAQDEQELSLARAKFQQATELEHAEDWSGALRLFRQVGQVRMTPQVRYHIATCEAKLGKLVAALGGFELALSQSEEMPPAFIEEVRGSVDALQARIPKVVIQRGEGAEAAIIELDGVALGAASIGVEVALDPGPHSLVARAPGREDFSETVSLAEGELKTVAITLAEPPSLAPEPEPVVATTTATSEPRYGVLPYVLGGIGVAGLVTSGVFYGLNQSNVGWIEDRCGGDDCTGLSGAERRDAMSRRDSAQTQELVMWTSLGVGVGALGAGIALYLLDQEPAAESLQLTPNVGLRTSAPSADAGVSVVGSF